MEPTPLRCPDEETLIALSRGDAAALDAHVDACSPCRAVLADRARSMLAHDAPAPCAGRYELRELIGSGSMGIVYEAVDPDLRRRVAVKVLRDGGDDLLDEARSLARVAHENVVAVHDVGVDDGRLFVVMERVEGETLARWLGAPRSWRAIVDAFVQAGRGLCAAHGAGVVHRDFKPANVFVGVDGRVRVGDFGLARREGSRSSAGGTPAYMAPEQRAGEPASAAADQYAFGVALRDALGGAEDGKRTPRRILRAIARATAHDPAERYPSTAALLEALAVSRRPRLVAATVLGSALFLALVGVARRGPAVESAARATTCTSADDSAGGFWDPTAKARVRSAFESSRAPFGARAFEATAAELDAYATAWTAASAKACAEGAARVADPAEARLRARRAACLAQRREEARSLVVVLGDADASIVERAPASVASLVPVSRCELGGAGAEFAAPADPALAAMVVEIRSELARANALFESGRYAQSLTIATAARGRAQSAGDLPVHAEAAYAVAKAEAWLERPDADAHLADSIAVAGAADHPRVVAQAWLTRAFFSGARPGRRRDAELWVRLAREAVTKAGNDERLATHVALLEGHLAWARGDALGAIAALRGAHAVSARAFGERHPNTSRPLQMLAIVLHATGALDEGRALAAEVVARREEAVGPQHPLVAASRRVYAMLLIDEGRTVEARVELARARDALAAAALGSHPERAAVDVELARAALLDGDPRAARDDSERALALLAKRQVPSRDAARAGAVHAAALARLGHGEEALKEASEARAALALLLDPSHVEVALVDAVVADALDALGRREDARETRARALVTLTAVAGPRHPVVERLAAASR